jgi:phosphoglycolate phosphatase
VAGLLVLWDVDHTLADTNGVGRHLYQLAFTEMFGGELPRPGSMAGRTDRAIALEVLNLAGVPEPRQRVGAFEAALAAHAPGLAGLVAERARALPGAAAALAALAGRQVVQSLLTGNIRALAEVKLGPLGLTEHLDLAIGAYGDASEIRAELVPLARGRATLAYGGDYEGEATVLVGDTPLDIEAALVTGARAVGVATGSYSAADLADAGAHAVLADLTSTRQVLAAILAGPPR